MCLDSWAVVYSTLYVSSRALICTFSNLFLSPTLFILQNLLACCLGRVLGFDFWMHIHRSYYPTLYTLLVIQYFCSQALSLYYLCCWLALAFLAIAVTILVLRAFWCQLYIHVLHTMNPTALQGCLLFLLHSTLVLWFVAECSSWTVWVNWIDSIILCSTIIWSSPDSTLEGKMIKNCVTFYSHWILDSIPRVWSGTPISELRPNLS